MERHEARIKSILEEIRHPSEAYSPIPFWFFNDEPDEGRIRAELEDYVEKGVNGFVLHPRIGVPESIPYLSEEFFRWVRFIVSEAARLHMKVVLYDEGMYPSGSAHGMVVAENPDYASKGVYIRDAAGPSGAGEREQVICALPGGRELVYGFTGGTIRGIHFGEDDGEAGAPVSADILNPDAVECFIRLTHDRYYRELKEYFGNTVIGFFTDEPCALGRNAARFREWAPGMEKELAAAGGLEELEGLFTGRENRVTALYHRLIKKYLREIFYARLSKWCEGHGIELMGHPAESDDVEEEWYFHVPGQDLIMRRVAPETGGLREPDSVQAKLTADIARFLGRERNMNECFGVCNRFGKPWYFTGRDMIWYLNWMSFRGVNLFVPHAFYYSLEGARKEERPPDVGPGNIWWGHYRAISNYIKRLSWLMTGSEADSQVAVLCDNNHVPGADIAELYERQIMFEYLPVPFLTQGAGEGKRSYSVVLNLLGAEWDALFADSPVKIVHSVRELLKEGAVRPALETDAPCPDLRAVRLVKDGVEMYLVSNEGEAEAQTKIRLLTPHLLAVDLWKGEAVCTEPDEPGMYSLKLLPCQMLLLIPDREASFPVTVQSEEPFLGDWTEKFELTGEGKNRAEYAREFVTEAPEAGGYFCVTGEEMAECWCNGAYAGFSLYGPHRFSLKGCLKAGKNEIRLAFTGNAANVYGPGGIPFGLGA